MRGQAGLECTASKRSMSPSRVNSGPQAKGCGRSSWFTVYHKQKVNEVKLFKLWVASNRLREVKLVYSIRKQKVNEPKQGKQWVASKRLREVKLVYSVSQTKGQ